MEDRQKLRIISVAPLVVVAGWLFACEEGLTVRDDAVIEGSATIAMDSGDESPAVAAAGSSSAPSLGRGFLVWESNRNGAWRIWTRQLDGSEPRRLTPNRRDRQHCCAQISPDGSRVAYLELSGPLRQYPQGADTGSLRLIGADGSGDRELVAAARTYHENRVVVWKSASELIHLTVDGRTALLDVDGGQSQILVGEPAEEYGWLIDSTLRHATAGLPSFSPYDRERLQVSPRQRVAGCQAYFSQDGAWGYWMAGGGGPIHRIDLATREVTTLLRKNDPRLPQEFGYLYFPMTSDDGRFLAVGASRGAHDHFRADYEIFVFETDPRTLEVRGPAVRLTFDPAVDRFPDIFAEPLALGDHSGEAPFAVHLETGREGEWAWALGEEQQTGGATLSRTFDTPGIFRVTATAGDEALAGMVRVAAAAPPRVVSSALRAGGGQVVVWFDEEIATGDLQLSLESARSVTAWRLGDDGRSLVIDVEPPIDQAERLVLDHLTDRAQKPNVAARLVVALEPPLWPSNESDLAFLWQTGAAANLVRDRAAGVDRAPSLQTRGRATFDHAFAMTFAGGSMVADRETAALLVAECQRTNEVSLELTLTPDQGGDGTLLSLRGARRQLLVLEQRGDTLWFRTLVGRDPGPAMELFPLAPRRAIHLAVTYRPGLLRAYRDGELAVESTDLQGDFFHWKAGELGFGTDWRGTIEGVAIYSRVLEPAEVLENAQRYRALRAERPEVPRAVIEVTRLRSATPPRLADISPYREALVVAEYRVETVLEGELEAETVRVAEWVVLGGEELPRPADRATLTLERFADNPQLESVVLGQDLAGGESSELYYALP